MYGTSVCYARPLVSVFCCRLRQEEEERIRKAAEEIQRERAEQGDEKAGSGDSDYDIAESEKKKKVIPMCIVHLLYAVEK